MLAAPTSSESVPLFRPAALEALADRYGSPVRPIGVSSWLLAAFLLALLASVIAMLAFGSYSRKETVAGSIEPKAGALRISAPRAGTISALHVREGQVVSKGDPILTMALDTTNADGRRLGDIFAEAGYAQAQALARQAAARQLLIQRQRAELAVRRESIVDERDRFAAELVLQKERVGLVRKTADAAKALHDKQLLATIPYRQREEALIGAMLAQSSLERQQAGANFQLEQVAAQDARLAAEALEATASAEAASADLVQRRAMASSESQIVLTAGQAGSVTALQARPGALVAPGATMAVLLPKGVGLQAVLWAPSKAVGLVRPGDRVRLMYDAFPFQRFGVGRGRVVEIARAPTLPGELPMPLETKEALFRILVEVDEPAVGAYGRKWPLRAGMRLNGDLILERQSLLAWLVDKVRAVSARSRPV